MSDVELIQGLVVNYKQLKKEIGKVIVGQAELVEGVLIAFFSEGSVLIEGVPGLAKTLTVRTLAGVVGGSFQRLQFTPDMLPADVIGTQTSNGTPEKRARKLTAALFNFRLWAAVSLILRMILPSLTCSWGTLTPSTDASTTMCGVWPLSPIHSCIARMRYGRFERLARLNDLPERLPNPDRSLPPFRQAGREVT